MASCGKDNLIILAYRFEDDFKQFLASHDFLNNLKLQTGDTQSWYHRSIQKLVDHPFESELNKHPAYKIYLKNVQRLTIHKSFLRSDKADVLFNIFLLKMVSAALEIHGDPTGQDSSTPKAHKRRSLDSKIGKYHIPSEQTANTARRLVSQLESANVEFDWMNDLKALAAREPYPQLKVNSKVKAMVKEITVWSEQLFEPPKSPKGRIPISAIQNILELVDLNVTDEAIRIHQDRFSNLIRNK